MSPETMSTVVNYLKLERKVGAYRAARESKKEMEAFYERAVRTVAGSDPSQIAFADSASRAWNMALYGMKFEKGDRIVTLSSEFGTNLLSLFYRASQVGASVVVIRADETGGFDINDLAKEVEKGARVVAISHAAAQSSIVNPVKQIGQIAKRNGALYVVDGCQAVGQIPVDVKSIRCDAYTATGRKWLRGPRGTGFLYVNPSSQLKAEQIDLSAADFVLNNKTRAAGVKVRKDARQFELWERSVAGMLGLSSAMDEFLKKKVSSINRRISAYANRIRKEVSANDNLNLLGQAKSESGVVGFYARDARKEKLLLEKFEKEGIEISIMHDWDCPLYFPRTGVTSIFRLSPHYYTPESSIDAACEVISKA
ncbi:MAG: aminotransferase class V [Candidatus Micrarchaeum acidiphilum ARMAN-2]|uniref:Aminotransferase class V n=1 Tax=Candidatus Micrarchaeum acidiphilum ARMAN-2 TaxID=425595 RepID=C7DGF2_MICA2|nr:MAG: aminotransferase class V [Candidatus Micrarchaeum acidiphilum ARMAN-2]